MSFSLLTFGTDEADKTGPLLLSPRMSAASSVERVGARESNTAWRRGNPRRCAEGRDGVISWELQNHAHTVGSADERTATVLTVQYSMRSFLV